jgi:hypothetical protein
VQILICEGEQDLEGRGRQRIEFTFGHK